MKEKTISMNTFLVTGHVNYKDKQHLVLLHTDYKNVTQDLRDRVIEELRKMDITSGYLSLSKHDKLEDYTIDEHGLSYSKKGGGGFNSNFLEVMVLKK